MIDNENSIAFKAAKELVFDGINQPSGYTEPILHKRRLEFKSQLIKITYFKIMIEEKKIFILMGNGCNPQHQITLKLLILPLKFVQ